MKCPRCLKKGKKVNMKTNTTNYRYKCPVCDYVINWSKK
jgi:transposase-like protein